MSVVCHADGCRFNQGLHVTTGHRCPTCNSYGHSLLECGKGGVYSGMRYPEEVPAQLQCTVPGCYFFNKHTTQGHECQVCHKYGHSCAGHGGGGAVGQGGNNAGGIGGLIGGLLGGGQALLGGIMDAAGGGNNGQVICHAPACRFPRDSHVTLGHQCGLCRTFGHSNPECGKGNQSGSKYLDLVPADKRCTISGCDHPEHHTLAGHQCAQCGKFGHSCSQQQQGIHGGLVQPLRGVYQQQQQQQQQQVPLRRQTYTPLDQQQQQQPTSPAQQQQLPFQQQLRVPAQQQPTPPVAQPTPPVQQQQQQQYQQTPPSNPYQQTPPSNPYQQPPPSNPYQQPPPLNPYQQTPPSNPYQQTPPSNPYQQPPPSNPYQQPPPSNPYQQPPPLNPYQQTPPLNPYQQPPPLNPYPYPYQQTPPGQYYQPPPPPQMYSPAEQYQQQQQLCEARFDVIKMLGAGGFGEALLVRDKLTNEECVMKRALRPAKDNEEQQSFVNEVTLLQSCSHPNIVKCYGWFLDSNTRFCIVMEYAPNGDLTNQIDAKKRIGGKFTEGEVMKWFIQLARALSVVHDHKIIHRDIKCANVFLDRYNNAKLGDFGVGKQLGTQQLAKTIIGTPVFMAPEIFFGTNYGTEADIWSLACLLYELTMLDAPYNATNVMQLQLQIMSSPPPQITSSYSEELKDLAKQMFNRAPDQRPNINAILQSPIVTRWIQALNI